MEKGINVHPLNGVTSDYIENFYYVRFPIWHINVDGSPIDAPALYNPFINELWERNIWSQCVLDENWLAGDIYTNKLRQLVREHPQIKWVQLLNEWDGKDYTPSMVDRIIAQARRLLGSDMWITLGAVFTAEGPSKLKALNNLGLVNAVAFHPYGVTPGNGFDYPATGFGNIQNGFAAVQAAVPQGMQIECSEWGGELGLFDDEAQRVEYYGEMLKSMAEVGIARCAPYCLTYAQHQELSLLDRDDNATERYAVINDAPRIIDDVEAIVDMRGLLPANGEYAQRATSAIDMICIHYTALPDTVGVHAVAQGQLGRFAAPGIRYPAIAYHVFVAGDGTVYQCHSYDKRTYGSGAQGVNARAVHICYAGNDMPNAKQKAGIRAAIAHITGFFGRPLVVEGHKDRYATACPGPLWPLWKAEVIV